MMKTKLIKYIIGFFIGSSITTLINKGILFYTLLMLILSMVYFIYDIIFNNEKEMKNEKTNIFRY